MDHEYLERLELFASDSERKADAYSMIRPYVKLTNVKDSMLRSTPFIHPHFILDCKLNTTGWGEERVTPEAKLELREMRNWKEKAGNKLFLKMKLISISTFRLLFPPNGLKSCWNDKN